MQSYRMMSNINVNPNTVAPQGVQKPASGATRSPEIDGSKFEDMLSKAEKQFILEKFLDVAQASKLQTPPSLEETKGRNLDIKA